MRTMFFQNGFNKTVYAVGLSGNRSLKKEYIYRLGWLLQANYCKRKSKMDGPFIGPRIEMLTPYSTSATEVNIICNVPGIVRIEKFELAKIDSEYDPMLQAMYKKINQKTLVIDKTPDPILYITEIEVYNQKEGLALSQKEVDYLKSLSNLYGRPLTDSEIFGFGQANSEHCRHKIFNGTFVIDGVTMEDTLFGMIKKTMKINPGRVVSAYTDNCAVMSGPDSWKFSVSKDHIFTLSFGNLLITIKAETHNFPTTVCAFPGAATGTGGEIRDRMALGRGSIPIAGTATYMTSYPRFYQDQVRSNIVARKWLYQDPIDILIRASDGASDFGNKFGQPLINGSVLTFEGEFNGNKYGYDKVIMQAGGIGFAYPEHLFKGEPETGDLIILLGGDNYRIGMGGGSVSSVNTGHYVGNTELNAVQRANPEMQKRVENLIRFFAELGIENPFISVHDHGAGGHVNCFSELVGKAGGIIYTNRLPVGDESLSLKEIIGNESQERMAILIKPEHLETLQKFADKEKAPMFNVGEITGNKRLVFKDEITGEVPFDMAIKDLIGNPPKTIMEDVTIPFQGVPLSYSPNSILRYLYEVLRMESTSSKDYLTSKVDRSVTGLVAQQQCVGPLQLPLSNFGAITTDFVGYSGVAISTGHSPIASLIDVEAGVKLALVEALTNLIGAPLKYGITGVSCSANWMWPCRNPGEDARLFKAVKALSEFGIKLEINIPTGKDSCSQSLNYPDGKILAPGTVIISAMAEISDVRKIVTPVFKTGHEDSVIIRIDFSQDKLKLGGSTFAQSQFQLGDEVPIIKDDEYVIKAFMTIQELLEKKLVLAAHDVSADGLVPTLLEMCFADNKLGAEINLDCLEESDLVKCYFANNPCVILQVESDALKYLKDSSVDFNILGKLNLQPGYLAIEHHGKINKLNIEDLRDEWFSTSYEFEKRQSNPETALVKKFQFANQPIHYNIPDHFTGKLSSYNLDTKGEKIVAAIIRDKGSNGDREMAFAMRLAGFEVKDVHMSMLISGEETLEDVQFIAFVGGFSNSDVLGSARGWAGSFMFNAKAKKALDNFYARDDTMSFGVCNGAQLMVLLNLINPKYSDPTSLVQNISKRFESDFVGVDVDSNPGIMLSTLQDSKLGIWIAHGEGRFLFPYKEYEYNIALTYSRSEYPANPNGSQYNAAAIVSDDGRHLASMPHPERCLKPHNWGYYPENRSDDEITPWFEIYVNAIKWIRKKNQEKNK